MSKLQVKYDPRIVLPEIEIPNDLKQIDADASIEDNDPTPVKQTDVYGILCPLICINGIVIGYQDIHEFELDCTGVYPTVSARFYDRGNKFKNFERTLNENEIQIQILPPFDNAYKKINLLFYATEFRNLGDSVKIKGVYKSSALRNQRIESWGELTTYELCDKIASELGIGFASNESATSDKRFIYSNGKSFLDILSDEIERSVADSQHVFDAWIDQQNYLNLCNIYERYNTTDSEDDLCVWIADTSTPTKETEVQGMPGYACFNNVPTMCPPEFFFTQHKIENNNINYSTSTDRILMAYSVDKTDAPSGYVYLGDKKENNTISTEYLGEYYGGYNYLFSTEYRTVFKAKMKNEVLHVYTSKPTLSIIRGSQVRVVYMDADSRNRWWQEQVDEVALNTNSSQTDMGWLKYWIDAVKNIDDNSLYINMNISGQYTVTGQIIRWINGVWNIETLLVRPPQRRIEPLPISNDPQ